MARKQYPSDHRRYFRVMEDILDDPGYRNLSAHDKVAWLDLLARFNRQKAHQTGNMIVLPWSRALAALSSQHRRGACATASRLARDVHASFSRVPEGLLCYIPNWAKLQGLPTAWLRRVSVVIPSPTPTPTPTKKREEKKEPAASAAPPSSPLPEGDKRRKRAAKTPFPEPFPPELRAELYRWAPGARFTEAQVDIAILAVADWALGDDHWKASWVRTIQNAMRKGWALKGYTPPAGKHTPKQSENWNIPESERPTGPVEIESYRNQKETA